ncbi:MAG: AAA family ATPase [Paracraurococcus sp.]
MAIAFARARYLSRSSGGNAVRSAAYNARESLAAERTGEVFHFRHRGAPEHHVVLLPDGADPRLGEAGALWNGAEAAERRKDAQVARELVLALPADHELATEDRIELARSFAAEHFVSKGLAVQLDVHAPHDGAGEGAEGERANWHAHLLVTTRRVEGAGFAAKKARDLDPEVRRAGGRAVVAEGDAWGALWRDHQDRYFQQHGIAVRVDATAAHPGEHIGPVRMRRAGSAAAERAEALREANQDAARDPRQVLAALTRNNATFDGRDLDRYLAKHLGGEGDPAADGERQAVRAAVLGHRDVLALHDRDTGAATGRYTTREVREQERQVLAEGAAVAGARHHQGVKARYLDAAIAGRTLRDDQRAAVEHAAGAGGLKLIEGRAGTGKSYALAAVRDAHQAAGHRVVGLAPTNAVAQDLKRDGFAEAGTVHAALFALKNGRAAWDRGTVAVVDEAAMLDTRVLGELLGEARRAGAKVILAGDDRQLASIERGGLFAELRAAHGSAEITEVTRQRQGWQREAARDLAEGRFGQAVAAFDREGAITWSADGEAARAALVAAWTRDTAAEPAASRFVFAYTNADVDRLNANLRQVRRDRGELDSPDHRFGTKHGHADFAVGDRVPGTRYGSKPLATCRSGR